MPGVGKLNCIDYFNSFYRELRKRALQSSNQPETEAITPGALKKRDFAQKLHNAIKVSEELKDRTKPNFRRAFFPGHKELDIGPFWNKDALLNFWKNSRENINQKWNLVTQLMKSMAERTREFLILLVQELDPMDPKHHLTKKAALESIRDFLGYQVHLERSGDELVFYTDGEKINLSIEAMPIDNKRFVYIADLPEIGINLVQDNFIAEPGPGSKLPLWRLISSNSSSGLAPNIGGWEIGSRVHTISLKNDAHDTDPLVMEIGKQAGRDHISAKLYGEGINELRDYPNDDEFQNSLGIRFSDFVVAPEDLISDE